MKFQEYIPPPGKETPELDADPIIEIHRGNPNGYVCFVNKNHPEMKGFGNVGAVKVKDVAEYLPGILSKWISYDGYFTVNTYYKAGGILSQTSLPYPLRKERNLTQLTACFADLDYSHPDKITGKPITGLTYEAAARKVLTLQERGIIPAFSIMAYSGRGMYLFWLLRDQRNPEISPPAYTANLKKYKDINKALHTRLCELVPDKGAHTGSQVLRVPGSIHTGAQKRVKYLMQSTDTGRITYTIKELEDFLQLNAPLLSLPDTVQEKAIPQIYEREPYRKTKAKRTAPRRRAGYRKINALRAADFQLIEQWRGGFLHAGHKYPDGYISPGRRYMLSLYAQYLKGAGESRQSVEKAVNIMAGNCRPAYPSDAEDITVKEIIQGVFSGQTGFKKKNYQSGRLAALMGITENVPPELLEELNQIIPEEIKAVRVEMERVPKQEEYTKARQDAVRNIIENSFKIPSLRKMQKILTQMGIVNPASLRPYSKDIIRSDYAIIKPGEIIKEKNRRAFY